MNPIPLILSLIAWELTLALLPMALTAEAGRPPPLSDYWVSPLAAITVAAGVAVLWGAWDSIKGDLIDAMIYALAMGWYIASLTRYIEPLGDLYGALPGYEPFALSMMTLLIIPGGLLICPMVYLAVNRWGSTAGRY